MTQVPEKMSADETRSKIHDLACVPSHVPGITWHVRDGIRRGTSRPVLAQVDYEVGAQIHWWLRLTRRSPEWYDGIKLR